MNLMGEAHHIEIYTAYTFRDKRFFEKVKDQLDILQKQDWPISCHESEILHSTEWKDNDHLNTAHLILLLVSTPFLKSDFCYCKQIYAAVNRQKNRQLCFVIPILLHPLHEILLKKTPFGTLDFLPTNGKPISEWKPSHKAYADIMDYLLKKIAYLSYYL